MLLLNVYVNDLNIWKLSMILALKEKYTFAICRTQIFEDNLKTHDKLLNNISLSLIGLT